MCVMEGKKMKDWSDGNSSWLQKWEGGRRTVMRITEVVLLQWEEFEENPVRYLGTKSV